MKWHTNISRSEQRDFFIQGISLTELVKNNSFTQGVFLILKGRLPKPEEDRVLNAILTVSIEHGLEPPSTFVARTTASTGNSIHVALAAGILNFGQHHGGAVEDAINVFSDDRSPQEIVNAYALQQKPIPGFGHKKYKEEDPRATALFEIASMDQFEVSKERARAIERELSQHKGRKIPLNVDGAIAALLTPMGFDGETARALFILGRLPGLIAHVREEHMYEKPYRRLEKEDIL